MNKIKRFDQINIDTFTTTKETYFYNNYFFYNQFNFTIYDFSRICKVNIDEAKLILKKNNRKMNFYKYLSENDLYKLCLNFDIEPILKKSYEYSKIIDDYKPIISHHNSVRRTPIVTIIGHINHGKTSLIDQIQRSNIADNESGNITQHLKAYSILYKENKITFVDTPGHSIFNNLRKKGCLITDIIILIISLKDGIQEQTIESINYALKSKCQIIVAINKIDLVEDKNEINILKNELKTYNITSTNSIFIPISAKNNINIDKLLDTILEISNKENNLCHINYYPFGYVIETGTDKRKGKWAMLLTIDGTAQIGDYLLINNIIIKIQYLEGTDNKRIETASPATPFFIYGLREHPRKNSRFIGSNDLRLLRQIVFEQKKYTQYQKTLDTTKSKRSIRNESAIASFFEKKTNDHVFNIILNSDTFGSLEAIYKMISQISINNKKINIIKKSIIALSSEDIQLANKNDAVVYLFNSEIPNNIKKDIKRNKIIVKEYDIIYMLINDIEDTFSKIIDPNSKLDLIGRAKIKKVYDIDKIGKIAGCIVTEGIVKANTITKLVRKNTLIHEGKISNLKIHSKNVSEVLKGKECGISLSNFNEIEVDDLMEFYTLKK